MSVSSLRTTSSRPRAFTLVELIAVLVILGIVAAIAIPTYRTIIDNAQWRALESDADSFDRGIRLLAASNMDGTQDTTSNPQDGRIIDDYVNGVGDNPGDFTANTLDGFIEDVQTATAVVAPDAVDRNNSYDTTRFVSTADGDKVVCLYLVEDAGNPSSRARAGDAVEVADGFPADGEVNDSCEVTT